MCGTGAHMNATNATNVTTSANVTQLYRALGVGLLFVSGASLALGYFGISLLQLDDAIPPAIAYAPSAIAVAELVVSLFVLTPRVPSRPPVMSLNEFWSNPEMGGKAVVVWFLVEGGGILAAVGYQLTRQPASAFVIGLSIAAYWWCGPTRFAKE